MSNSVVTKACTITHGSSTMEKLKVGDVLVNPAAGLLAEIATAGGTVRAAATNNLREVDGEAFAASNASG
jgi:hypothetical protein